MIGISYTIRIILGRAINMLCFVREVFLRNGDFLFKFLQIRECSIFYRRDKSDDTLEHK